MTTQRLALKNIAIIAHVDHGKTTLLDGILHQSGTFESHQEVAERVMDSGDIERERGITIQAKNCAINWKDVKLNILDTPGHADFGGEVERSLRMVDTVLLLVDAAEGPLPQTRFVLQKSMQFRHHIVVIINKIDRPDERTSEVKGEIEDLLLELASDLGFDDFDCDIPFFYASAKNGYAKENFEDEAVDFAPLLNYLISDVVPQPKIAEGDALQVLVNNLSYSPYLGQLMIGRIQRGSVRKLSSYMWCGEEQQKSFKVSALFVFDALEMKEVDEASAGEIVIIAGIEGARIGDSVTDTTTIEPLPRISIEPPTVSVCVSVNTSTGAGTEGKYLTSRNLETLLVSACRMNVALQYEATDDPKVYALKGRGELQLAIVFEEWRRLGHEFMVSRPEVVLQKDDNGKTLEPFEEVVFDVPTEFTGVITEKMAKRQGKMEQLQVLTETRSRLTFSIPSRGLIGYRSVFITDTRGEGLMSSLFLGYRSFVGHMLTRQNGAIIADRKGVATGYALFNLLAAGRQIVKPGDKIYEGMVVGEHIRTNDLNVNVCREKQLTNVRASGKDEAIVLPPISALTLETALDWMESDEWVEVTPESLRIRKRELDKGKRSVIRDRSKGNGE